MKGLTSSQVDQLLKQHGQNILLEQKKKNIFIKFFEQFNNFLTILLMIAAIFSFFIGESVDGILIITIVVLNAFFGLYQEAKAEESIKALKKMSVTKIRVIRDGKEQEIESMYLVPGDIFFIEEGTKIPADGVISQSMNLEINESVLTGESMPITKNIKDEIYSGTIVSKGRGLVKVVYTGMNTKFGSIAAHLSSIDDTETPLQIKLRGLTRIIGIVGIILAIIVFVLSYFEGSGYFPAFLLAISLAVAVVPEGLPAVMTITLAIGVNKMAGKKAIIRKLSAIEALGSITLIATDKTGTLTTNKMKVKEVYVDGKVHANDLLSKTQNKAHELLVLNGVLCSTASLVYIHERKQYDVLGDPTEGALLYLAQELDLTPEIIKNEWNLIDEKPFDSITKMMSVLVEKSKSSYIFTKGAPESVIQLCERIQIGNKEIKMNDNEREKIEIQIEKWASKGLRVLAFSYSNVIASDPPTGGERGNLKNIKIASNDNIFLGLVAIHDAPRPEVYDAVMRAKEAGIKVIMITGDNEKTAEAIGVTAGILQKGEGIMNGQEIDTYSDEELMKLMPDIRIFARTSPFQKFRIVKLFQKLGEIVAVTGDGVNDAIALKQADVGVAMGLVGTDVARETADMVITDDNFATIVNAVEEGRNIIKNLKNAIKYLLSCNITEGITLIIGLLLGFPTLFYAIQLLYINLITDGLPALTLSFSPKNPHIMQSVPEKELTLLKYNEKLYIFFVGIIASFLVLFAYFIFSKTGVQRLGNTAAFSVLTLIQSFIFIDLWLSHQSIRKNLHILRSPLFLIAFIFPFLIQFTIVQHSGLATLFKIAPASIYSYIAMICVSALILVGIKGVKKLIKI
ncbi:MAG: cation-translocating P-type ATPase [bacterium]|nr:cation-translocating P-type ATPase [bacterium]